MDEDKLAEEIDQYEEPLHDLIQELLWEYFQHEDDDITVTSLAVRKRRLQRQREMFNEQIDTLKESVKDIDKEIEIIEDVTDELNDELFDEALETCSTIPADKRDPNNLAIKTQSEAVGLNPQQFIERLNEQYPTDHLGQPILESSDEE